MFLLLLFLINVCAYVSPPIYKINLLHAKEDENKRIRQKYSRKISRHMYKDIIKAARKGDMEYIIEFNGCENINLNIDHTTCHHIIEDVFTFISTKFPDTHTHYDFDSRIYKVSW